VNDESGVYMRERAAGLYRLSAYVLAVMTTEIIGVLLTSTVWAIIVYWMVNLMPAGMNFIVHWLVMTLLAFTVQSFGMLISVLMSSGVLRVSMANCYILFSMLTSKAWLRPNSHDIYCVSIFTHVYLRFGGKNLDI